MPWWNPITWVNGALLSAQQLNEQIRDNLRHLKGLDGAIHLENAIDLTKIGAPGAPATGRTRVYADVNDLVYAHNPARGVIPMTALKGRVWRSTPQSIPNYTPTPLSFDGQELNGHTNVFHSTTVNPERLTVPTTGWYVIGARVTYPPAAAGWRALFIDSFPGTLTRLQVTESDWTDLSVSTITWLPAGEFVVINTSQVSGGALNAFNIAAWIVGPL